MRPISRSACSSLLLLAWMVGCRAAAVAPASPASAPPEQAPMTEPEAIVRVEIPSLPELSALLATPRLQEVVELDLSSSALGDEGAAILAGASLPQLRRLRLDHCGVGRRGAAALAESALLDRVTLLSLAGVADLWEGGHPKPFLGPRGAAALAGSPHLGALEELRLPLNAIGDDGAVALARAIGLGSLRRLDLRANEIGDAGAMALLDAPWLAELSWLDLRDNPISEDALAPLVARLGSRLER